MTRTESCQRRIDAALGRIDCDLKIQNVSYLDVFSCEWRTGDVIILDGTIVALDAGLGAKRVLSGKGKALVPGFIDAHVHVESSCLTPKNFEAATLPKGTTTAVCDPHELANVLGVSGIQYFLDESLQLAMDLKIMLSSCVPATHMETNGGGVLSLEHLKPLQSHANSLGLAEMMNVPGVLFNDSEVLAKLVHFSDSNLDGHCPLLRGRELSAYAATGVSSCHESTQLEEAREKLIKGMRVWIREGSVAKDLHTLAPLLTLATSTSLGFCTDDRNPLDIVQEGHLDYLVRESIRLGIAPEVAYRASSWSVARHYGLDRGWARKGAIAPGYLADLILLEDKNAVAISEVFTHGRPVSELTLGSAGAGEKLLATVKAKVPEAVDLVGPSGNVHVMIVNPGKIITDREVAAHDARGVARITVLERYGHGSKPANAYVRGFGIDFSGAIASSVGHDSHNLIVVGKEIEDMRLALATVIADQGGFAVVKNGSVLAHLPLPIGGLMSQGSPKQVEASLKQLRQASRTVGCALPEPFLQLAFLSLPVIPSLKLTDKGLVDVGLFKIISVRAS